MSRKSALSAILAISLATSGVTFAQGNDRGRNDNDRGRNENDRGRNDNDRGRNDQGQRDNQKQAQPAQRAFPGRGNNANNQGRARVPQQDARRDERGAGPNHDFRRGDRLPVEYRHHSYVVDDWRGHQLSAPPRGYHWVQTGGDYVLVAIATGIILQILLGNN